MANPNTHSFPVKQMAILFAVIYPVAVCCQPNAYADNKVTWSARMAPTTPGSVEVVILNRHKSYALTQVDLDLTFYDRKNGKGRKLGNHPFWVTKGKEDELLDDQAYRVFIQTPYRDAQSVIGGKLMFHEHRIGTLPAKDLLYYAPFAAWPLKAGKTKTLGPKPEKGNDRSQGVSGLFAAGDCLGLDDAGPAPPGGSMVNPKNSFGLVVMAVATPAAQLLGLPFAKTPRSGDIFDAPLTPEGFPVSGVETLKHFKWVSADGAWAGPDGIVQLGAPLVLLMSKIFNPKLDIHSDNTYLESDGNYRNPKPEMFPDPITLMYLGYYVLHELAHEAQFQEYGRDLSAMRRPDRESAVVELQADFVAGFIAGGASKQSSKDNAVDLSGGEGDDPIANIFKVMTARLYELGDEKGLPEASHGPSGDRMLAWLLGFSLGQISGSYPALTAKDDINLYSKDGKLLGKMPSSGEHISENQAGELQKTIPAFPTKFEELSLAFRHKLMALSLTTARSINAAMAGRRT